MKAHRLAAAAIVAAPTLVYADPKSEAKIHVDRATEYHQDGRYAYALGELEVAYTLDPQPDLLFAIGQIQNKLGACGKAVHFYKRFVATTRDADARAAAAEAIAACTTGPTPEPNHVERATELHKDGKFADALAELTLAYTLDPQPDVLFALGQLHAKLDDCNEAALYYQRFLESKPDAGPAAAAREAIETCGKRAAPPPPTPPPPPPAAPTPPVTHVDTGAEAPWYKDTLGDTLAGGAIAAGAAALVMYSAARGNIDDADRATTYADHEALVDRAHSKRAIAAVLGVAAVGLGAGAVARYVLHDRSERSGIALVPTSDGAFVTWSGRFR